MRLPSGRFEDMGRHFPPKDECVLLGCLGPEERSIAVPLRLRVAETLLLEIHDPPGAFPDYTEVAQQRIYENQRRMEQAGFFPKTKKMNLLCPEQDILGALRNLPETTGTLILDITSLPKRFFCFILRRLLTFSRIPRVIVTYTKAARHGHNGKPLMSDFDEWNFLPGFGGTLFKEKRTLVLGVGFEPIDIPTLIQDYREENLQLRVMLSFPADAEAVRREWATLRKILRPADPSKMQNFLVAVSPYDAEAVYLQLKSWGMSGEKLMMAPFGPKPHTLGMALFAVKENCNLVYTQPKSYNPDYTKGAGDSWAYIVKWDGVACYDRPQYEL